jgi:hypothetical protein
MDCPRGHVNSVTWDRETITQLGEREVLSGSWRCVVCGYVKFESTQETKKL